MVVFICFSDINECEGALNDCIYGCINTNGSYQCSCPVGMSGDGREHGTGCKATKSLGKSLYVGKSNHIFHLTTHEAFNERLIMRSIVSGNYIFSWKVNDWQASSWAL